MICLIAITEHHAHENNFQKTYQQNRSRNISTQNVDSYGSYTPFWGHFSQIGTPCVTASVCPSLRMNFEFRASSVRQVVITKIPFLTKRVKYLKKWNKDQSVNHEVFVQVKGLGQPLQKCKTIFSICDERILLQ